VALRRARRGLFERVEAHWLLPALVIFLSASSGRMNIGERYILAMYPYLILLMAAAARRLVAAARGQAVVAALVGAHALSSLLAAPGGCISYFNVVAAGAKAAFAISPNILLGLFDTPGHNPWAWLLQRKPAGRAGVYFIYRID
jgi:hypothetical protein